MLRPLEGDEAAAYYEAVEHLREFESSRELFRLVRFNLEAAERAIAEFVRAVREEEADASRLVGVGAREINAQVVNLLTAFRLYLEHTSTRLQRRYGEASAPFRAFEEARTRVYDQHREYAFVYKLRNYVQHCGMPLQVFRNTTSLEEDGRATFESVIGCARDLLLREYDAWTHAKPFLQAQPDEFEILPHLRAAIADLDQVDRAWLSAAVPEYWRDAHAVAALLQEASHEGWAPSLAEVDIGDGTDRWRLSQKNPPLSAITAFRLMEPLDRFPGWRVHAANLARSQPPCVE